VERGRPDVLGGGGEAGRQIAYRSVAFREISPQFLHRNLAEHCELAGREEN
jgi:hypothetical protein